MIPIPPPEPTVYGLVAVCVLGTWDIARGGRWPIALLAFVDFLMVPLTIHDGHSAWLTAMWAVCGAGCLVSLDARLRKGSAR